MRSLVIVELEPGSDSFSSLTGGVVFIEIDLFPFEASPEAFCEDVIRGSPFSVHGNLDVAGQETLQIAGACEMASLIAVPDVRNGRFKGPVHTRENKRHLQGAIEFP